MLAILLALTSVAADAPNANWPGFLGTGGSRTTAKDLPLHWSPDGGIAWQVELAGYGQSAPIIWGEQVFVTSIEGPNKDYCLTHAYHLRSGKLTWSARLDASQKREPTSSVSRAAPTPVVDASGIYVFFESGDIAKYSHAGQLSWQRSLVKEYGEYQSGHGIGSSLAQADDKIFLLIAHSGPSYLLALDKATGQSIWKTDRESGISWTSPVVAQVGAQAQVIVSSGGAVTSYDANDGKQLWQLNEISGNSIPSPSIADERVLIGASVSRTSTDERLASRSNCCLRLTTAGEQPSYVIAWRASKATSSYATPLAHHNCAYFLNKVGVLYCLDLTSGEQHYAERIDSPCWASPIAAGDHIYFFGKNGVTTVVKAGPEFSVVATNRLWNDEKNDVVTENTAAEEKPAGSENSEGNAGRSRRGGGPSSEYLDPIVYGAAATDGAIVIRTGNKLYCVGK